MIIHRPFERRTILIEGYFHSVVSGYFFFFTAASLHEFLPNKTTGNMFDESRVWGQENQNEVKDANVNAFSRAIHFCSFATRVM